LRTIVVALVAATAILVAGCGGSSDNAASTVTTVETVTEASTDTTPADTSASTDTASTDTTASADATSTDTTSSGGGGLVLSAGCKKIADLSEQYSKAIAAAGASGSSQEDLQKQADAFKSFAEQVPEEIRGAFTTIADAYVKYATAFKDLNLKPGEVPDAGTIAKIAAIGKSLDSQKLQQAVSDISTWTQKNCTTGG
jgi:hypothetical protein